MPPPPQKKNYIVYILAHKTISGTHCQSRAGLLSIFYERNKCSVYRYSVLK